MKRIHSLPICVLVAGLCFGAAPARTQAPGQGAAGNWPKQQTLGPGGVAGEVHDVNALKNPNVIPAETVLSANPALAAKLQALLPENFPVLKAASGYGNLQKFSMVLHATHDLDIPFADFKCAELGGKFCAPESKAKARGFGKSLEMLKPGLSRSALKAAAKMAKDEAKSDTP